MPKVESPELVVDAPVSKKDMELAAEYEKRLDDVQKLADAYKNHAENVIKQLNIRTQQVKAMEVFANSIATALDTLKFTLDILNGKEKEDE